MNKLIHVILICCVGCIIGCGDIDDDSFFLIKDDSSKIDVESPTFDREDPRPEKVDFTDTYLRGYTWITKPDEPYVRLEFGLKKDHNKPGQVICEIYTDPDKIYVFRNENTLRNQYKDIYGKSFISIEFSNNITQFNCTLNNDGELILEEYNTHKSSVLEGNGRSNIITLVKQ